MLNLNDIHPLSDFQRNSRDSITRLRKTGRPEVLTVNGRAEVVVQSAAAYQHLLDRLEAVEGIRRGLDAAAKGEGISADAFERQIRAKHFLKRS